MAQQHTAALGAAPSSRFNPLGPFSTYAQTALRIVTAPAAFFKEQASSPAPAATPSLVFALASIGLSTLVGVLLTLLIQDGAGLGIYVSVWLCVLIAGPLTLGPGSLLAHLLVKLLVPGHKSFRFTFRALAYSQVATLAACLPGPGGIATVLGAVALSIVGMREVHQTTPGRAAVVVLVPATLLGLLELAGAAVWFMVELSNQSWMH